MGRENTFIKQCKQRISQVWRQFRLQSRQGQKFLFGFMLPNTVPTTSFLAGFINFVFIFFFWSVKSSRIFEYCFNLRPGRFHFRFPNTHSQAHTQKSTKQILIKPKPFFPNQEACIKTVFASSVIIRGYDKYFYFDRQGQWILIRLLLSSLKTKKNKSLIIEGFSESDF